MEDKKTRSKERERENGSSDDAGHTKLLQATAMAVHAVRIVHQSDKKT